MFVDTQSISLFFGDASRSFVMPDGRLSKANLLRVSQKLNLKTLVLLRQNHGVQEKFITAQSEVLEPYDIFSASGDILLSDQKMVGVGMLTADCLPLVFYDNKNRAVAVVHAGWRGTVESVAVRALQKMVEEFNSDPAEVTVFFGPSAQKCCYEVSLDFLESLEKTGYAGKVIEKKGGLFFDLPLLNKLQLIDGGINPALICEDYMTCTICDASFNSHRRDGKKAGRQATVVVLR